MTAAAIQSLTLAARLVDFLDDADVDGEGVFVGDGHYTAAALRDEIRRGLDSLRQQPGTIDDIGLHARLTREIARLGGQAVAARAWGMSRQEVHAALSGTRPVPPRILSAIGLRRVGQRSLYREV